MTFKYEDQGVATLEDGLYVLEDNLKEIKQIKKDWPDRAVVVSLMVPCNRKRLEVYLEKN